MGEEIRENGIDGGRGVGPDFFAERRCVDIARNLLGMYLFRDRPDSPPIGGRIVETEAYLGDQDPACHLAVGRTGRTEPFFHGAGTVYVFKIYSYANLNFISEYNSHPECVLIRALRPTDCRDEMFENRGVEEASKLASGPGRLTEALGVTKDEFNDESLDESDLRLVDDGRAPEVKVTERIGISDAEEWPLRFCVSDSDHVSKARDSVDPDHESVEACYETFDEVEQTRLNPHKSEM